MKNSNNTSVTVVVPTKNRPMALSSLLAGLQCQSLKQFDLIMALNGKESWNAHLDKLVMALESRKIRVKVHECLEMTFSQVHAHLMTEAETEFVCRMDDDHVPHPHYLQELKKMMDSDPCVGAAGGIVLHPEVPGHSFSKKDFLKAIEIAKEWGILNTLLQLKMHPSNQALQVPDLYSSFMMRKKAVDEVGGIATCYTSSGYREETDLTLRMTLAGYKQYINPKALVWHIKADQGGERKSKEAWEASQRENDALFQGRMREHKEMAEIIERIWNRAFISHVVSINPDRRPGGEE